jgi:hypothetical protein
MSNKTKEQLEDALFFKECIEAEREKSDKLYAKKIVELIVYGAIGLIATGFIYFLLRQIQWR